MALLSGTACTPARHTNGNSQATRAAPPRRDSAVRAARCIVRTATAAPRERCHPHGTERHRSLSRSSVRCGAFPQPELLDQQLCGHRCAVRADFPRHRGPLVRRSRGPAPSPARTPATRRSGPGRHGPRRCPSSATRPAQDGWSAPCGRITCGMPGAGGRRRGTRAAVVDDRATRRNSAWPRATNRRVRD